ncbi:hypothetical protein DK842_19345 [Chromobacterium phragmitis]|uniref:hypothetical protein n=1 Tax=Chromobacterium phragmitis TaxID=2202141 RepID=UPI000DEC0BFD|nr:hypothetical protein [Chromobacterium phragmitis]AXE31862.1 hypothetical protein DK842_19345 [Chromobacterium phragmitis]
MFESLLRKWGWDAASRQQARERGLEIDRLLHACDRRLCLLPNHQQALAPGMRISQDYLSTLTEKLPPVLELSLPSFSRDRRLGLLFAGPSSLLELLEGSDALRDFFSRAANGDEAWALMTMRRSETGRFGVAMENGELRNDVAQTVVSFDGHRLQMPCASEDSFHRQSGERALHVLTAVIAGQLSLQEQTRLQLEAEQGRLQLRKLALKSAAHVVLDEQDSDDLPETLAGVDQRLKEIRPLLESLRELNSLEGGLDTVRHILEHPRDYFSLESVALRLNRMGVKVGDGDEESTLLQLEELVLGKERPTRRALMAVRVRREHVIELRQQFGA